MSSANYATIGSTQVRSSAIVPNHHKFSFWPCARCRRKTETETEPKKIVRLTLHQLREGEKERERERAVRDRPSAKSTSTRVLPPPRDPFLLFVDANCLGTPSKKVKRELEFSPLFPFCERKKRNEPNRNEDSSFTKLHYG